MIRSFSVENFRSIRDKQTFSFVMNDEDKVDGWFIESPSKGIISSALGIFGPNASGKTGALSALAVMLYFTSQEFFTLPEERKFLIFHSLPWFHNKHNKNKATKFSIEIEDADEGNVYLYEITIKNKVFSNETLKHRTRESRKYSVIFERIYDPIEKKSKFKKHEKEFSEIPMNRLPSNSTVLSMCPMFNIELPFLKLLSISTNLYPPLFNRRAPVDENFIASNFVKKLHEHPFLKETVTEFIRNIDLGIESLKISKASMGNGEIARGKEDYFLSMGHPVANQGKDNIEFLPFFEESEGTLNAVSNYSHIMDVLETGGIAVLDELDSCLHPNLVEFLLGLFNDKAINKGKGQILFSSHFPLVMDILGASHVILVEKNEQVSDYYPITDVYGAREDLVLRDNYIAGSYGAKPRIKRD